MSDLDTLVQLYAGCRKMANIHIDGESIKTKKDAEKLLKDANASFVQDGWVEHQHKLDDQDKKYNKEMYKILKDRVKDRQFSFNYAPGQWEAIFCGGEGRDKEQ